MKPLYRIHSANPIRLAVKATVAGQEIDAEINGLEVEFVPVGHAGGSMTHRFPAPDAAALDALRQAYPVGHLVKVSLDLVDDSNQSGE